MSWIRVAGGGWSDPGPSPDDNAFQLVLDVAEGHIGVEDIADLLISS